MTWSKLSDDFTDDCWTLSDAAFRLHVEGLCWSNRKLLDLVLPGDDVRRFAKHPEAATELVAAGWWTEQGDAYVIRHHAAYQRTRADVVKRQETSAANGRQGGRPPTREQAKEENPAANPVGISEPENPVGDPVANQHSNPGGQDRTGQALRTGAVTKQETDWPTVADTASSSSRPSPEPVVEGCTCSGWVGMPADDHMPYCPLTLVSA